MRTQSIAWRHLLAIGLVLAAGAGRAAQPAPAALTLQDDEQNVLHLPHAANRIVSLAPGATAMLFAAGAGSHVVGTSEYSEEPPAAHAIARIGDAQSFDLERILALHPDVVVVWSGGTSAAQVARLQQVGLTLYRHRLRRLQDIPASVQRLGVLAGTETAAQAAAADYARRIAALRDTYAAGSAQRVLIQVWDKPIYTVGRDELITDVLHLCGDRSLYEDLPEPGPAVTLESVLARDPDIILALAPDAASQQQWLADWRRYPTLKAVRADRVLGVLDPRLSRLGPSMVDATEDLCRTLHAAAAGSHS